jgi:CheY-like chemotaxis protein
MNSEPSPGPALRASRNGARASLVALTGWGQDEDRRRVRAAGFDHHLVKPADISALAELIAQRLAHQAEDAGPGARGRGQP